MPAGPLARRGYRITCVELGTELAAVARFFDGTLSIHSGSGKQPAVLAAIGQSEELKTHLRGALNLGWTVDELREALLQIGGYAGFPAAHEALRVLSEIVTQR